VQKDYYIGLFTNKVKDILEDHWSPDIQQVCDEAATLFYEDETIAASIGSVWHPEDSAVQFVSSAGLSDMMYAKGLVPPPFTVWASIVFLSSGLWLRSNRWFVTESLAQQNLEFRIFFLKRISGVRGLEVTGGTVTGENLEVVLRGIR